MNEWEQLSSSQDVSVNFIRGTDDGGHIEARYVRRDEDYFVCYLSSHTGCEKACRMCHLTATGQTMFRPVTEEQYLEQAETVLSHYAGIREIEGAAQRVNFNWMARGEPLSNPYMQGKARQIFEGLHEIAAAHHLEAAFNLSTIMPEDAPDLIEAFPGAATTIYYSLYSLDPGFRRRWLPKAIGGEDALERIAAWQAESGGEAVLHWAFIEGENDSETDVARCLDAVAKSGLKARFNLVRYNPPNEKSRESNDSVLEERLSQIAAVMPARMIQRVGFDVKASCGMFIGGRNNKNGAT